MMTVLERYGALADRFTAVVDALGDADWDRPSPCDAWTGREVLHHVVTTQRAFLAGHGVDLDEGDDSEVDRRLHTRPSSAWHVHDGAMRRVLADDTVARRGYDGLFGRSTIGAAITAFYGFDLIVHRWDLAQAAGRDESLDDAELDAVEASADGFGEHLYGEGVCQAALDVSAGADRQTRVLARLGRRSGVSTA